MLKQIEEKRMCLEDDYLKIRMQAHLEEIKTRGQEEKDQPSHLAQMNTHSVMNQQTEVEHRVKELIPTAEIKVYLSLTLSMPEGRISYLGNTFVLKWKHWFVCWQWALGSGLLLQDFRTVSGPMVKKNKAVQRKPHISPKKKCEEVYSGGN